MAYLDKFDKLSKEVKSYVYELLKKHHALTESTILDYIVGTNPPPGYRSAAALLLHNTSRVISMDIGEVETRIYFLGDYRSEAEELKARLIKEAREARKRSRKV